MISRTSASSCSSSAGPSWVGGGISWSNCRQSSAIASKSSAAARRTFISARHPRAREQELRGQVLERREPLAHASDLLDRERATGSVERRDRLSHAEVARGPCVRTREMAREEPVRGPAAEPADRRQRAITSSSSSAASASRSRSECASSSTYSAFAREKPSGVKCRGRSSLMRSRVGNSQATSCRTP